MKKNWSFFVIILTAAAVLRMVMLGSIPPGLQHDEVANWLIDREILAGNHSVYFTQAYGHEAGYHYLQAAVIRLIGDHALGLRLPTVFSGLVVIAASVVLAKRMFGERVAIVSATLLAIMFWPIFFSRIGIRAMLLPVFSGLAAYFFWRGLDLGKKGLGTFKEEMISQRLWMSLAGAMAGLSLYTYMAARAVPIVFLLFSCYLLLFHRSKVKLEHLVLFFFIMMVSSLPLVIWLVSHPGVEYRITEINKPLTELLSGNFKPVLQNAIKLIGFFGWQGDPLVRQNIIHRPVFDPVGAVLFYTGLVIALWRWRRPEFTFIFLWLACSLIPSLVTSDAPSSIRCINALPVVGIFVGLSLEGLAKLVRKKMVYWVALLWLLMVAGWTINDYFVRWPRDTEVQFVWQTAFHKAADYLDAKHETGPVVIAGWTPATMDPPSMDLFNKNTVIQLRFVDPRQTLLFPSGGGLIICPTILPINPLLYKELINRGAEREDHDLFTLFRIEPQTAVSLFHEYIFIDEKFSFVSAELMIKSSGLEALTFWQAGGLIDEPLRIFLHVLNSEGNTAGQDDALGSNSTFWKKGDLIVQMHRVRLSPGEYRVITGLYNPETGERKQYQKSGGFDDTIEIGKVTIP